MGVESLKVHFILRKLAVVAACAIGGNGQASTAKCSRAKDSTAGGRTDGGKPTVMIGENEVDAGEVG